MSELEMLRRRCERLELLNQVTQVIHSTLEPREALVLILREAVRVMRATSGSVVLVNPTTGFLEIEVSIGLPERASRLRLRVGEGITGWVAQTGQPARVGDVTQDARYIMVRRHARSELAVPLEVNGEVRGVLNVDSDRLHAFTAEDEELLRNLARPAARVIHHTWLYEQIRHKARLLEALVRVGQTINSTQGMDEALIAITRQACLLMQGRMSSLLLLDASRQWLELRASHGAGPDYITKPRLPVEDSLLGVVIRRQKPLQVENVQVSSLYQHVEIARREGLVSLLSVPLMHRGQVLGALNVYTGDPHSFSNEEIGILSALAELSATAIEKARLYDRVAGIEEQLRQNEKLSALGLLAAEVAHEIRNPLTVMKMLFHSLHLEFPSPDPRAMDVRIISEKMDHLNRIVERVLDFARHNEPKSAPVGLNGLLDDLLLLVRQKLARNGIRLVYRPSPDLPSILGDATLIEQAFLNLILNALEAMPQGGTLAILTRLVPVQSQSSSPQEVLVLIRDTGSGMTQEQQRTAFTSLLQTTKTTGSGIGLALVARVIEAHHGRIRIHSRPGRGASFSIYFPCAQISSMASP